MRFKMNPGEIILEGGTHTDIVRAMADQKIEPVTDLAVYRHRTAERVHEMFGHEIHDDTDYHFVVDLVACGLLEQLS